MSDTFYDPENGRRFPKYAWFVILCSTLLFLGAIGLFIWLIVFAAEHHLVSNILYGAAFLTMTIGLLIYSIFVYESPAKSKVILWTGVTVGLILYIVGVCLPSPAPTVIVPEESVTPVVVVTDSAQ